MIRRVVAKKGKRSITQELLLNVATNVRKWLTNWKTADTVHLKCGTAACSAS